LGSGIAIQWDEDAAVMDDDDDIRGRAPGMRTQSVSDTMYY